jgi:hypothetical protein
VGSILSLVGFVLFHPAIWASLLNGVMCTLETAALGITWIIRVLKVVFH